MLYYLLLTIAGIIVLFHIFWKLYFLRDPVRAITTGDNILSPADGRIIKIMEIGSMDLKIEKGILGKIRVASKDVKNAKYLISIFMTPLDVHVQRSPINGRVAKVRHNSGTFISANTLKAFNNENNEILIEDYETVKVIQIAGFLARRIECFVKEGQHLFKGQRIGRINLGSQVSMILPKNINIRVAEGQKVRAGETIIADLI